MMTSRVTSEQLRALQNLRAATVNVDVAYSGYFPDTFHGKLGEQYRRDALALREMALRVLKVFE